MAYLNLPSQRLVVQLLSCVQLFATPRLLHAELPCTSPSPGLCLNLCPLSQCCHLTISSSAAPFYPCPQSFLAWRSFLMSWLFTSGCQNVGASTSASVLPMNIQGWFSLGSTGLISLLSKRLWRVFCRTTIQSISSLELSIFMVQFSHPHMTTGKTIALTTWIISLSAKWCLCFLLHSLGLSAFLPRSKRTSYEIAIKVSGRTWTLYWGMICFQAHSLCCW